MSEDLYLARLDEAKIVFKAREYINSIVGAEYSAIEKALASIENRDDIYVFFENGTILSIVRAEDKLYILEYSIDPNFPLVSLLVLWEIPLEVVEE
jgi:hypothetical protein